MSELEPVAVLANSKKSSVKSADPLEIRLDLSRNIRESVSYDFTDPDMKTLVQSMLTIGFMEGKPCVVTKEEGYLDLLQGHRRYIAACEAIRLRAAMSEADRARVPEIKYIPCYVLTGLSDADKLQVIVDVGNIKSLNEVELLECVRRLVHAGMGRNQIAAKLGRKPGWVQQRQNLLALPPSIERQWVAYQHNKANKDHAKHELIEHPVGWADIGKLHQASVDDRKQGVIDVASGTSFQKAVSELKGTTAKGTRAATKSEDGAYNPTQIRNLANSCHRAWLRRLFLYLCGDVQNGDIRTILDMLEQAHDTKFGTPETPVTVVPDLVTV